MDAATKIDLEAEVEKSRGRTPKPPAAEQAGRLERVRSSLEENKLDGLFIFGSAAMNPEPIRYLSNYLNVFPGASALLLVPREAPPILLIDQAWHIDEAAKMSWIEDVRAFPSASGAGADAIAAVLRDAMTSAGLTRGRLGVFRSSMPCVFEEALSKAAPNVTLAAGDPVWRHVVATPSAYDLEMIRATAGIADAAFEAAAEAAGAGVTEYEVCTAALSRMAALGAEFHHGSGVSTHINIGSHSDVISNVRPHLFTTARLEPGQMFWLDLNAAYGGYFIDMDRTFAVGEPTPDQRRLYDVTVEIYDAMRAELRAGARGGDVAAVGDRLAAEAGLAENANLVYLGHTTGITTSSRPFVIDWEELTFLPGSVVNLEPGIYVPGVGSACLENAFLVGEDSAEPVNRFPLEIQVV